MSAIGAEQSAAPSALQEELMARRDHFGVLEIGQRVGVKSPGRRA